MHTYFRVSLWLVSAYVAQGLSCQPVTDGYFANISLTRLLSGECPHVLCRVLSTAVIFTTDKTCVGLLTSVYPFVLLPLKVFSQASHW